jgi:hypothetical protein
LLCLALLGLALYLAISQSSPSIGKMGAEVTARETARRPAPAVAPSPPQLVASPAAPRAAPPARLAAEPARPETAPKPVSPVLLPPFPWVGGANPPPAPSPVLRVTGIITGSPSIAVLTRGEEHFIVQPGDRIDGELRVQSIGTSSVTLEAGNKTRVLRLGG